MFSPAVFRVKMSMADCCGGPLYVMLTLHHCSSSALSVLLCANVSQPWTMWWRQVCGRLKGNVDENYETNCTYLVSGSEREQLKSGAQLLFFLPLTDVAPGTGLLLANYRRAGSRADCVYVFQLFREWKLLNCNIWADNECRDWAENIHHLSYDQIQNYRHGHSSTDF